MDDRNKIKKPRQPKETGTAHFEVVPLLKKYPNARYYFLLGARSAGKTYPTLKQAIQDAIDGKGVFAYVRRYKESIADSKIQDLLKPHKQWLSDYTDGKWNDIQYYRKRWYLVRMETDEDGVTKRVAKNPVPIGGAFAMNTWETDKGPDFGADKGGIAHIIVDEVLSAGGEYLNDEWKKFENVISSLVRDNFTKDTKIWLLSNPVSRFGGPYLKNLGISKKLLEEFGTTEIKYPKREGAEKEMSCIFVYIAARVDKKGNTISIDDTATQIYDTFFAFPNSDAKRSSITHGYWEMDDANLLEGGMDEDSVTEWKLYFVFDEECLCCECRTYEPTDVVYLFIRPAKRIPDHEYFVTMGSSLSEYAIIAFGKHPMTDAFRKIYVTNQVYYSDLTTADAFHGFTRMVNAYKP